MVSISVLVHTFFPVVQISLYAVYTGGTCLIYEEKKDDKKNKVQSGIWPHFLCVWIFLCWLELELSFLYEAKKKKVQDKKTRFY